MFHRYLINFNLKKIEKYHTDFLVIGSGLAGLYVALNLSRHGRVMVLSKTTILGGSSLYAQGGIAAAMGAEDSPACHFEDTIIAGAGLCNEKAVKILVKEGPDHVKQLIKLGAPFDLKNGRLAFSLEGAHSQPRVLHAGGDATGREICKTLTDHVSKSSRIDIMENAMAIDLLAVRNRCRGVMAMDNSGKLLTVNAGGVIIATGGIGQIYKTTTNPEESTGDGIAMALRAGAAVKHMEFIQFHPTSLNHPRAGGFLISEAVRGEGAVLRNIDGDRFMQDLHPRAELAPRDIVARGIYQQIYETGKQVFLDATHFSSTRFKERFPSIYRTLQEIGLDPSKEWIPVTPAAHYLMGGILTDMRGRTNIRGLYACGETACTGVNGANRLASNSLLECLVFGSRAAESVAAEKTPGGKELQIDYAGGEEVEFTAEMIKAYDQRLRALMEEHVGIMRNARGLKKAIKELEAMISSAPLKAAGRFCIELQNKIHTAHAVATAALARRDSCGAHYRTDTGKDACN